VRRDGCRRANRGGPDGHTPFRLAAAAGRTDLCDLLRGYHADDQGSTLDLFLSACLRADREETQRQLADDPNLLSRLGELEHTGSLAPPRAAATTPSR